jgi:hypothetical protein
MIFTATRIFARSAIDFGSPHNFHDFKDMFREPADVIIFNSVAFAALRRIGCMSCLIT